MAINKSELSARTQRMKLEKVSLEEENLMLGQDEDVEKFPEGGLQAYLVVLGSLVGLIGAFGVMNGMGAIEAYIQKNQLKDEPVSSVAWVFSTFSFVTFYGSFIVGPLFDRYGAKYLLMIGTVCLSGGLFATGSAQTLYQFVLAFGLLGGLGCSLLMTPLIGVVSHWFLKKRAQAIGLAMTGGSMGGVIVPIMLRSLYTKVGFPWALRCLGFLCLFLCSVSVFLAKDRSEKENLEPLDFKSKKGVIQFFKNTFDFTGFKDKRYSFLVAALFLFEFSLFLSLTYLSSYALAQGVDESRAYLMLTIMNATGIPGRYIPGYFADKLGRFNMMCVASVMMSLAVLVIWLPFGSHVAALFFFAAFYGFFSASVLSLIPVCCGQICKTEDFGKRYGTAYSVVSFGILVGLPVGGAIIGEGTAKQYSYMVVFAGAACGLGGIFFCTSRYFCAGMRPVIV